MKRKIIQHGPSSLTISIPSSWAKKNNLKKGNEIDIIEKNKDLIIKSSAKEECKSTKVSFTKLNKATRKDVLLSLHQKGYHTIEITDVTEAIIKEIYTFLNNNQLSLEITKQAQNSIIIENISNPDYEQLNNLSKRAYRILIEYAYKILNILESKESITENCYLHEKSINRISNYCKRIIINENDENSIFKFSIINDIVSISNQLSLLIKILDRKTNKKEQLEMLIINYRYLFELLQESYNLHNKFSLNRYSNLQEIINIIDENINNCEDKNYSVYCIYITNINELMKNLMKSILTLNL